MLPAVCGMMNGQPSIYVLSKVFQSYQDNGRVIIKKILCAVGLTPVLLLKSNTSIREATLHGIIFTPSNCRVILETKKLAIRMKRATFRLEPFEHI